MHSVLFVVLLVVIGCDAGSIWEGTYGLPNHLIVARNPVQEAAWVIDMPVGATYNNIYGYAGSSIFRINGVQYDEVENTLFLTLVNPHEGEAYIELTGRCHARIDSVWEDVADIRLNLVQHEHRHFSHARVAMTPASNDYSTSPSLAHHVCYIALAVAKHHVATFVIMLK
jgi:hypothetical protein